MGRNVTATNHHYYNEQPGADLYIPRTWTAIDSCTNIDMRQTNLCRGHDSPGCIMPAETKS